MEEEKRRAGFLRSNDISEIWHSTPVKQKNGGASPEAGQRSVFSSFKVDRRAEQRVQSPADSLQDTQFPVSDLSSSTVQRQRRELQLLMAELKDRDSELNAMLASHHKQLHAWEQDRQRALTLEKRGARLEDELQKRNEVIGVLTKRVWAVETREEEVQKELHAARHKLRELEQKQQHLSQKCDDFEEKNRSLSSTVMALSSQVGSLQVREEELSSKLKLKDRDVAEASGQIGGLAGRLRDLEAALTESRSREDELRGDSEDSKRRYREAKHDVTHLREELQQQLAQSSAQREETIRLKQELQLLHRDLALTGEGDSWRDELLALSRSKQERAAAELHCLRQVCENQCDDLQLLQLSLQSARDALREQRGHVVPVSRDELTCGCLDKRSSSSLRAKTHRLPRDPLQDGGGGVGVFSGHLTDGDDPPLSSCSLQQLLEESRRLVQAGPDRGPAVSRGAADPLLARRRPNTPTHAQADETPPTSCPHHQPDAWTAPCCRSGPLNQC